MEGMMHMMTPQIAALYTVTAHCKCVRAKRLTISVLWSFSWSSCCCGEMTAIMGNLGTMFKSLHTNSEDTCITQHDPSCAWPARNLSVSGTKSQ